MGKEPITPEEINEQRLKDKAISQWLQTLFYAMGIITMVIYILRG